ncbi:hypothetical protein G7Y89_g5404 [Cudoniella acicularis]|uniref:Mcm2 3 5 family protein n=1 Tax=Cudoniella acicularis TaxID=354080 RepID=A0A8H4RMI6_9HELO|nr:hypothetical protein G7Y89_g5404 [Cudoniella acicularis]
MTAKKQTSGPQGEPDGAAQFVVPAIQREEACLRWHRETLQRFNPHVPSHVVGGAPLTSVFSPEEICSSSHCPTSTGPLQSLQPPSHSRIMSNSADRANLLQSEDSGLSDASNAVSSQASSSASILHRQSYHRASSSQDLTDPSPQYTSPTLPSSIFDDQRQGLGISERYRPPSISRVPVGSRPTASPNSNTPATPALSATSTRTRDSPNLADSSKPLLTPPWHRHDAFTREGLGPVDERDEHASVKGKATSYQEDFLDVDVGDNEHDMRRLSTNNDNDTTNGCPSKHDIHSSRTSWLSVTILLLSIYSTIFSGIWLFLAVYQPRYGRRIRSTGSLTITTASTVFALFAKTIELSFVTVFVTFLGQALSRRALIKSSRGITISEMTMRTWVIQPGSMITHWENLQHAGLSVVGAITLTAAFVAIFYTTASDTLVSPHLKMWGFEPKLMYGLVKMSYANTYYIADTCQSPISSTVDSDAGDTSYHNSITFLSSWAVISAGGEGISSDITQRPQAPAMLFDNTTVTGSWVFTDTSDVTGLYKTYNRVINNVTLAMPHAGVYYAARDIKNEILQPEELGGVGEYSLRASVVSPALNVMCVNANQTELAPLVYVTWPNATKNSSDIPNQVLPWVGYQDDIQLLPGQNFLNSTVLDDIFEWGPKYNRQPPVFGMWPIEYNSVTNITAPNSDSNYLFIKAPNTTTTDYTLCQIRGNFLESHCEDPDDPMAYSKSVQGAPSNIHSNDYRNVASQAILALSLNTGISNANASNARLLSQMILALNPNTGTAALNPLLPSIAELLAVLFGNTLLMSTAESTYYHYWNYTSTILDPGTYLPFNASLSSQEYTSGLLLRWQGIFYVVLALVFITNVFCLAYFFIRSGLVTDYTEPQNLFTLAVNSPPSHRLGGSCGAGPEGDQLNIDWHVKQEDNSGHFFIKDGGGEIDGHHQFELRRRPQNLKSMTSYSKLSTTRRSWL